jgi:hypothetical protein
MDIHFCDLCGVRVTDVDLRGGHGIRKQYDVICATCLELGHGKEWLASHQRGKSVAVAAVSAAQPAAAALAATASNKQAPVITQARDRVQTFEDGDESPAVAPQVLSAELDDGTATSELNNADVAAAAAEIAAEAAPKQPANHHNQFAAAASSFSALAASSKKVDAAADVDEGADRGEGLADESTASPIIADDENDEKHGKAGESNGESPFGFTDDAKSDPAQKDETLPVDREPLLTDKAASDKASSDKKKSSAGSASFKKSSPGNKSSTSNNKSANTKAAGRSGKGPAKKVNKNKNILMMSALSIGILSMILLITVKAMKKPHKEQERIEVDLSDNVKTAIKDAKFNVTQAINKGGLKELEAARSQIQAIVPEISKFEKAATSQNPPWTQEEMGQYLQNIGWTDVNSLIITVNQKIARLKAPGGGN